MSRENTHSLFTDQERVDFENAEKQLVRAAGFSQILEFWQAKRELFLRRAFERGFV